MPSPCLPPLASWANVVITYLPSDFLGLWQAMQFLTRSGATSRMKLTGRAAVPAPAGACAGAPAFGLAEDLVSSPRAVAPADRATTRASTADLRTGCIAFICLFLGMNTSLDVNLTSPPGPSPPGARARADSPSC